MSLAALLRMQEVCDIRPLMKGFTTPTLLLTGDRDLVVPRQQAQWVAHNLPRANLRL
jgi:pimeloyl-ACP methyl ester carboxylesterase